MNESSFHGVQSKCSITLHLWSNGVNMCWHLTKHWTPFGARDGRTTLLDGEKLVMQTSVVAFDICLEHVSYTGGRQDGAESRIVHTLPVDTRLHQVSRNRIFEPGETGVNRYVASAGKHKGERNSPSHTLTPCTHNTHSHQEPTPILTITLAILAPNTYNHYLFPLPTHTPYSLMLNEWFYE